MRGNVGALERVQKDFPFGSFCGTPFFVLFRRKGVFVRAWDIDTTPGVNSFVVAVCFAGTTGAMYPVRACGR